ncbi:allophanate hydrolase subunit 2 protein [Herbaspirillum rubrisubalbicans M1]|uniref:5-oxoprolinase subunit C family protein n=1 Tax=Herbaspirillum rubrisubalbicans TaxID=80842 RepID=UPI00073A00D3|nr:biotin-dependent carboxyltransferase family protein [Herbaspirillum rubrisubalbicans]ALU91195.1 allophanate hydrolase subunit 2 protein [Herbaspirillum rubrisubalbicans M1]
MTIKVKQPGLATSVQDGGREGYYHLGIPPSGALDQYALRAANLLVGNAATSSALECTLLGPQLQFQRDALVAVTGARMQPRVDGLEQPLDTAFKVRSGQVLSFDYPKSGARSYIAIGGGIDVPVVLESRSTYGLGALGGWQGRKLAKDDEIPLGRPSAQAMEGRALPLSLVPVYARQTTLRVVPGLYIHRLTDDAVERFFADTWTVGSEADRIGYRFKGGQPMQFRPREQPFGAGSDPSNIVDACYPIGSIQIPGGLEPIVLLRDAVSGGGYATIGTVISADLDLIGQLQPNHQAQFERVTLEQALEARRHYQQRLQRLGSLLHHL